MFAVELGHQPRISEASSTDGFHMARCSSVWLATGEDYVEISLSQPMVQKISHQMIFQRNLLFSKIEIIVFVC